METQRKGRKPKAGAVESPKADVKNVQVKTTTKEIDETPYIPAAKVRTKPLYDVFVKGKLRQLTKSAFETAAKDPALKVTLPPDSVLEIPKPCEGC